MHGLPGDEPRAGTAQEARHGGDLDRLRLVAIDGADAAVMRRNLAGRALARDEARRDQVRGHVELRKIVSEPAREADQPGLRRHDMHAVLRSAMRADAADIDDGAGAARLDVRQASLHAVKRAVEIDGEYRAPFFERELIEWLLAAQPGVV